MSKLVLIRHGLSRWNLVNRFTGWVDVPLAEAGIEEAKKTAEELMGIKFDQAYTSDLVRAQETLLIVLARQDRTGIFLHKNSKKNQWLQKSNIPALDELPIYDHPVLNERYYGDLQGLDKDEARRKFGEDKVLMWRRSWDQKPPHGESLRDVYNRVIPFMESNIISQVKKGKNVLVCAHSNSLRAIIKYIEKISDINIVNLEFPTGKAILYDYEDGLLVRKKSDFTFNRKVYWSSPEVAKKSSKKE